MSGSASTWKRKRKNRRGGGAAYETSEVEAAGVLVGTLVVPCHDVFVEKRLHDMV